MVLLDNPFGRPPQPSSPNVPVPVGTEPGYLCKGVITKDAAHNTGVPPQSGNVVAWWPADRDWFVYTPWDCPTTYVGSSPRTAQAVLAQSAWEAVPAAPDHLVDGHG